MERADAGSSATTRRGLVASARAMPILWRWPPEKACGKRCMDSGSRTPSDDWNTDGYSWDLTLTAALQTLVVLVMATNQRRGHATSR
jgi:hypothetical protein